MPCLLIQGRGLWATYAEGTIAPAEGIVTVSVR